MADSSKAFKKHQKAPTKTLQNSKILFRLFDECA